MTQKIQSAGQKIDDSCVVNVPESEVAVNGTGDRRKQDTHKMAEANKAFAHFRY